LRVLALDVADKRLRELGQAGRPSFVLKKEWEGAKRDVELESRVCNPLLNKRARELHEAYLLARMREHASPALRREIVKSLVADFRSAVKANPNPAFRGMLVYTPDSNGWPDVSIFGQFKYEKKVRNPEWLRLENIVSLRRPPPEYVTVTGDGSMLLLRIDWKSSEASNEPRPYQKSDVERFLDKVGTVSEIVLDVATLGEFLALRYGLRQGVRWGARGIARGTAGEFAAMEGEAALARAALERRVAESGIGAEAEAVSGSAKGAEAARAGERAAAVESASGTRALDDAVVAAEALDKAAAPAQLYGKYKVGPAFRTREEAIANLPHGEAHLAQVVHTDAKGNILKTWWEVSESGLPAQVGHTEQKALVRVRLKRGETLEVRGWHPPCPYGAGCHNVMEHTAIKSGGTIVYTGVLNGKIVERVYLGRQGHIPNPGSARPSLREGCSPAPLRLERLWTNRGVPPQGRLISSSLVDRRASSV
jgi:hypothetical protein